MCAIPTPYDPARFSPSTYSYLNIYISITTSLLSPCTRTWWLETKSRNPKPPSTPLPSRRHEGGEGEGKAGVIWRTRQNWSE
jgi:hypothetical protein